MIVDMRRTMLVLQVHAMMIVSQTVSRYGTARECKRDGRRNATKRVERGKNDCRSRTQCFRQSQQHIQLF